MVFSGVTGAPAQSFPTPPMTTLGTTPVSRDVPYLYIDSSGNYHVFDRRCGPTRPAQLGQRPDPGHLGAMSRSSSPTRR